MSERRLPFVGKPTGGLVTGEQATADHLRAQLAMREAELADIRRRPAVRRVLALDRRLRPHLEHVRDRAAASARAVGGRAALARGALSARGDLPRRAAALAAVVDLQRQGESDGQGPRADDPGQGRVVSQLSIVVLDEPWGAPASVTLASLARPVDLHDVAGEVVVVSPTAPDDPGGVTGRAPVPVHVDRTSSLAQAASAGVAAASGTALCLVVAPIEPLSPTWCWQLVEALAAGAVAATPVHVHPGRPLHQATAHDLLVRHAGLELFADPTGRPTCRARGAGSAPATLVDGRPTEVEALAGLSVVERSALGAAGGLPDLGASDLTTDLVDLSLRLRQGGGRVVAVPGCLVLDHRPVRSPQELVDPLAHADAGWEGLAARHGPRLVRPVTSRPSASLQVTITIPASSDAVAPRRGDWGFGAGLGRALEARGHTVRLQPSHRADEPAARVADVNVVLRGLRRVPRTPGQCHVLWIISHPEMVDIDECDEADLVLVASEAFADALQDRTTTPVRVMLQATDHHRFRPLPSEPRYRHEVAVIANARGGPRAMVTDALAAGLTPAIYGEGWDGWVDPALVLGTHVPNATLPSVYSSVGVLLNDHWDTMRAWGFVSNRLFDALACGTPVVSDHMPEIVQLFGDAVGTYSSSQELGDVVRHLLQEPHRARERASRGRELVLAAHTFGHRADQLLDMLASHRLVPVGAGTGRSSVAR